MPSTALTDLPDEILRCICFFVDWDDALSIQATCRRLVDVVTEPLLWKYHCRRTFKHWAASHHLSTKLGDATFWQWKQLFKERYEAEAKTRSALARIIASQTGRIQKIEDIVSLGYDAKDVLLREYARAMDFDDGLARRYWSHVALSTLHKSLALEEWAALRRRDLEEDSFERPVAAFDLFILEDSSEGDVDDIFLRLDSYVVRLRDAHPDIDDESPQQKASTVAKFLLSNNLIGMLDDRDYHNIEHNFLGRALFSQEKNSLPIITAIIYCYVLRQLGLRAAPCGFPLHVHAIVQPPSGLDLAGEPLPSDTPDPPTLYMDPFRTHTPIPYSSLLSQLQFLTRPVTAADHAAFLSASNPRDITIRCARNILNSIQRSAVSRTGRPIDPTSAHYAALWALVLLPTSVTPFRQFLVLLMHIFAEKFPHDVGMVERYILPLTGRLGTEHEQICEEVRLADAKAPWTVQRRDGGRGGGAADRVRFRVGQVFRHSRFRYTAVVTGWDEKCDADEEWIRRMGVDRLTAGRRQAFYHSLYVCASPLVESPEGRRITDSHPPRSLYSVQDDKTIRYVAEENIELLTGDDVDAHAFPREIGRWFKRWDEVERVFVSNVRDEYPDD